jgi:coproporphyrinogen III oxidase
MARGAIMIRANFTMKLDELDAGLIEKLKGLFTNDKLIEINVLDDRDETEYLLSTPANRESILRSLDQLKRHDIVSKSPQDLAI